MKTKYIANNLDLCFLSAGKSMLSYWSKVFSFGDYLSWHKCKLQLKDVPHPFLLSCTLCLSESRLICSHTTDVAEHSPQKQES